MYEQITKKILDLMNEGVLPWRKPWGTRAGQFVSLPMNAKTKRPYNGINVMLLWLSEFKSPYWATAKVWKEMGASVKEGQLPTTTYFFTFFDGRQGNRVPYCRSYDLFNFLQVVGAPDLQPPESGATGELIESSGAVFVDGNIAYYDIANDRIVCPPPTMFESQSDYFATKLHELAHWTGHRSRLNRTFSPNRRSPEYAFEELIAELASCFLAAATGVPCVNLPNHASYLDLWLKILGSDARAIFRAAAAAQRVTNYLLALAKKTKSAA